ncbi:hypothetical protein MED297_19622 [Reinekea sp. MED297]|uniref:Fibronectin type-III domain-containing protein n=1 Tax=Reinekea blandensis MED297 TaxID=314283 RepID=A4B929_9GAMM|nr:hypothetical protein MED297_19622 [Reinekea sp. MED297] [Reinekea blandensis MED297]
MTRHSFTLLVLLTSVLMGCQIELTPISSSDNTTNLAGNNSSGSVGDGSVPISSNSATATLYWSAPVERISGDILTATDIGGYEIRYKKTDETTYSTIVIEGSQTDQYAITDLEAGADYTFEVAVFDTDGVYSQFVTAALN